MRPALPLLVAALLLLAAPLAAAHSSAPAAREALPEPGEAPRLDGVALSRPARTVAELAALSSLVVAAEPVEGDGRDVVYSGGSQFVRRVVDVERELKAMAAEKPDLVKVEARGSSAGGLPLWMATFTNTKAEGEKLGVYLDGGHHGNEYLGTELIMVFAYYLYEGYGKDPEVTRLLDTHTIWILPILNPDGNTLDTRKNSNLVDINRNYPYMWGGGGAGKDPTSFTYRGPSPASEPEIKSQLAFAESHQIDLWVTMHSGIAEMYWPWSYTNEPAPDVAFFERLEKPFEEASRGTLDAMQSAELYIAAGDTEDYAYGTFGIPAFVFEVHPDQFKPVYLEGTDSVMVGQFEALKWLVLNTDKMGANIHLHDHEETAVTLTADSATYWLHNKGWADAVNVTLALKQGGQVIAERVVDLAAGEHLNVTFAGLPGTADLVLEGTYRELFINTSQVKTFTVGVPLDPLSADVPKGIPGAGLAPVLAALAVAGIAGARRLRRGA